VITSGNYREYQLKLQYLRLSPNKTQYEIRCKETSICKPSIFSSLPHALPVPKCFSLNIMHLPALNIPDLVLVEQSTVIMRTTKQHGTVWKEHEKTVAVATPYLPGSFDQPP
jgi:hypothetical protein